MTVELREYGEPGTSNIQWKGSAACIDIICVCGDLFHVCTEMPFSGCVRCRACGVYLTLGTEVSVSPTPEGDWSREHAAEDAQQGLY